MFLDILDSVHTNKNFVSEEDCQRHIHDTQLILFSLLITGKHPVLTIAHLMDSLPILEICLSQHNKEFLDLISKGYIKIFKFNRTLKEHFINSMSRGLNDENDFYVFSALPFLSRLEKSERQFLQEEIISYTKNPEEFRNGKEISNLFNVIDNKDREFLKKLLAYIIGMDQFLEKNNSYIFPEIENGKPKVVKIQLDELIHYVFSEMLKTKKNRETEKLINEIIEMSKRKKGYRSFYYNVLEKSLNKGYDQVVLEVKKIIDYIYNYLHAKAYRDSEGYILKLPNHLNKNIMTEDESVVNYISCEIKDMDEKTQVISWKNISSILDAIKKIELEENLVWDKALEKYVEINQIAYIQLNNKITIKAEVLDNNSTSIFQMTKEVLDKTRDYNELLNMISIN